jgi:hypothetical protein
MSHININELDLSKISLAKIGRNIILVYPDENGEKQPLQIVTGKMYIPFGVKINPNNYSSFPNCHIDCSLNQSNGQEAVLCREKLEELDLYIQELIVTNSHLFNTKENITENNILEKYRPILRENKTYPKLMKISLTRDSQGNFQSVIFDNLREKIYMDDDNVQELLSKGKIFVSIIECGRLWYYNGDFGSTWNLIQLKFCNPEQRQEVASSKIYDSLMINDD